MWRGRARAWGRLRIPSGAAAPLQSARIFKIVAKQQFPPRPRALKLSARARASMRTSRETAWARMGHQPNTNTSRRAPLIGSGRRPNVARLCHDALRSRLTGVAHHVRCGGLLQLGACVASARNSAKTPSSECILAAKRSRARSARALAPNLTWPRALCAPKAPARLPRACAIPRGKKTFGARARNLWMRNKTDSRIPSGCRGALGSAASRRPHRLVVRTSRRGRDNPGSTPGAVNCSQRGALQRRPAYSLAAHNCGARRSRRTRRPNRRARAHASARRQASRRALVGARATRAQ